MSLVMKCYRIVDCSYRSKPPPAPHQQAAHATATPRDIGYKLSHGSDADSDSKDYCDCESECICAVGCVLLREQFCTVLSNMLSSLVNFSHATFTIHYAVHFISRVLQSLLNPAIWLHHRPLHGVVSVRLQILLEGMFQLCRWQQSQEGDWARPHLVMWCDVCFRKCLSPNTAEILGWSGWSNRSFVMLFVTLSVPNILSNIAQ